MSPPTSPPSAPEPPRRGPNDGRGHRYGQIRGQVEGDDSAAKAVSKQKAADMRSRVVLASLAMLAGVFPIAIAFGLITPDPESIHAPLWVLGVCGGVFVLAGVMLFLGEKSRLNSMFGGILCLSFAAIGGWVALYAPSDGFEGGVPLISDGSNSMIARLLFGGGAIISFALALSAFKQYFKPRKD